MGYGAERKKKWKFAVSNRENKRDRGREAERNGGGWRDTESLVKVKQDSLRVVMEAG